MVFFWIEIGFGVFMILCLITIAIKTSQSKFRNDDELALDIVKEEMYADGYTNFELESITSLEDAKITTVIVNTGFTEIYFEVDMNSGKIYTKEKLAR